LFGDFGVEGKNDSRGHHGVRPCLERKAVVGKKGGWKLLKKKNETDQKQTKKGDSRVRGGQAPSKELAL